MDDIAQQSATTLAAMLRAGKIGCVELLEHFLARLERLNPALNAVIATDIDRAMANADAADEARANGNFLGPLHGLPITIKDALAVPGMPCTSGAPEFADYRPKEPAVAVARLAEAGAIIFGKTNVPLYCGDLQSYNEIYGTTNNPWDLAHTPGGSSGGAAAAVAAGLTAFEYGSDIGGSIRTPAHFCGVFGHKPSWDIVPTRGHIPGPPGTVGVSDINVVGPLARHPQDLRLALELTMGSDPVLGPVRRPALLDSHKKKPADFRIAVWADDQNCPVAREISDAISAVADRLVRAGARVNDTARPDIDTAQAFGLYAQLLMGVIATGFPETTLAAFREVAASAASDDFSFTTRSAIGAVQSHRQWLSANERRQKLRAKWAAFFNDYDLLLCPVTPTAAIAHDHRPVGERDITVNGDKLPYMQQTFWAGLVGMAYLPSTVVPLGRTAEGLPFGMQIVGPFCGDLRTIDFAELLCREAIIEGYRPPPGYG